MHWRRVLKYSGLYLISTSPGPLLGWLPANLLNRFRRSELKILFKVSTEGPGGFDDAVQMFVLRNPERYSEALIDILKKSRPGSSDEEVALFFAELVRGAPEIEIFLHEFAQQHQDPEVRAFLQTVLHSPVPDRNAV